MPVIQGPNANAPMVSARRNMVTIRAILAEHESARRGGAWVEVA